MDKINPKLIIGLGNPGKELENTRHNTCFLFIDEIAEKFNAVEFTHDKKLKTEISEFKIENLKFKIFLAKPQTFMNKSGEAVSVLSKFYKIKPENILIVHDDIDVFWGNFKFSFGRSSAGHKGVASIIKALKTKDFWRLRIGIRPALKKHTLANKIILKKFTQTELKTLNQTIKKAVKEIL